MQEREKGGIQRTTSTSSPTMERHTLLPEEEKMAENHTPSEICVSAEIDYASGDTQIIPQQKI